MKRSYMPRSATPLSRSSQPLRPHRTWKQNVESLEERKWKLAVRERDDFTCQRCFKVTLKSIHAHHIAPRSRRPDLKLDVSNGICLCLNCHAWCHSNPIQATADGFLSDETYELTHSMR